MFKPIEDSFTACQAGFVGRAEDTTKGTLVFCKRFAAPVEPSDELGEKARKRIGNQYDEFTKRRKRINSTLRKISTPGGVIVYPIDEFVINHHWHEVTELISNVIPTEDYARVIASLSSTERLQSLRIVINALKTLHSQHIVHADLKLDNIMLVKQPDGTVVSKIIDFDGAFFEDDVPTSGITGTTDYYSPELANYSNRVGDEDLSPEQLKSLASRISTKSDIFTMGIVIHEYLTGKKPEPSEITDEVQAIKEKDKGIFYIWRCFFFKNAKGERLQPKLDSSINDPVLIALLSDMLQLRPDLRPTAFEITRRLQDKKVPMDDAWEEHDFRINKEQVRNKYISIQRVEIPQKTETFHGYVLIDKHGLRSILSADELKEAGFTIETAPPVPVGFAEPWSEHEITWNEDILKANGFIACERKESYGMKMYVFYKSDKTSRSFSLKQLIAPKFAISKGAPSKKAVIMPTTPPEPPIPIPKPVVKPTPQPEPMSNTITLWPEDSERFMLDETVYDTICSQRKMVFVEQEKKNGILGYKFKTETGRELFYSAMQLKTMHIFKPKG